MRIKTWNIESMTGYKPRTTFYEDFSIADHFGGPAIRDTYCRAFNAWQNNKCADALNEIAWKDDKQVVVAHCERYYSEQPRLEIEISKWEPNDELRENNA